MNLTKLIEENNKLWAEVENADSLREFWEKYLRYLTAESNKPISRSRLLIIERVRQTLDELGD